MSNVFNRFLTFSLNKFPELIEFAQIILNMELFKCFEFSPELTIQILIEFSGALDD